MVATPPAGDIAGNSGKVLELTKNDTQHTLYVRSQPLQWACRGVACDCTFEKNVTLDGTAVRVEATLNNARSDHTPYPPYNQELPAVYTIGSLYRIVSYNGTEPFTNGPLSYFSSDGQPQQILASEHWAALVDDNGWGLAVFQPDTVQFTGNFFGTPGNYSPADNPTGYLAPNLMEILDWNIVYRYRFDLVLGNLRDLRTYAYQRRGDVRDCLSSVFSTDRQHWASYNTLSYWPVEGAWRISMEQNDPQIVGPNCLWKASQHPVLHINASYSSSVKSKDAQVFWNARGWGMSFDELDSLHFTVQPDNEYHVYTLDLSSNPHYTGNMYGLRFDPVATGNQGAFVDVVSIILK